MTGGNLDDIRQTIVARRYDDALERLDGVLERDPENADALYMSAVCRRFQGEFRLALDMLDRLQKLAPEYGRAHQEEGHTWRDAGKPDRALRAYDRACRYNPALEASWRGQLDILTRSGAQERAAVVRTELDRLRSLPEPLVAVTDLIAQGRLLKAEDICRRFLRKNPRHVEGMRLLAGIGKRLGALDDAEFLLESALRFQPDNERVHIDYIEVLRKRQRFAQALEAAGTLLERSPDDPRYQSLFAIESLQTGNYDDAHAAFDKVLARIPGDPNTLTSKGHAYKTCGEYDAAVRCYRDALATEPRHGEAWYALANLKVYTFSETEIAEMRALEAEGGLVSADLAYLSFALGKAYEDRAEYAASFRSYERGNRIRKRQSRYDAGDMTADLAEVREVCSAGFFAERAGRGHDAPDPIFIVGLPRAGSTLLEQILASHSQVDGTLELPNILSLSQRLRRRGREAGGAPYPQNLRDLSADELEKYGREYIEDTRIHRRDAPRFLDKMPNNFRHIGLIRLILPNAKVIDARRHPMACCFSSYKQLFAEGQEFTYDLGDLGRYYNDYVTTMDHWNRVLPGFVLRVDHEDVVVDLEAQVRRLLDFCELPFENACLEFHRTERSIRTPSSEQVRRPIFTSGLEAWRHYDRWLGRLRDTLHDDIRRTFGIH